jgi:mRNA interferase RelE/StbE
VGKIGRDSKRPVQEEAERAFGAAEVPRASVSGGKDLYKIKLAALGYRLVYRVISDTVVVYVLSVGKRQENAAYKTGHKRNK